MGFVDVPEANDECEGYMSLRVVLDGGALTMEGVTNWYIVR